MKTATKQLPLKVMSYWLISITILGLVLRGRHHCKTMQSSVPQNTDLSSSTVKLGGSPLENLSSARYICGISFALILRATVMQNGQER